MSSAAIRRITLQLTSRGVRATVVVGEDHSDRLRESQVLSEIYPTRNAAMAAARIAAAEHGGLDRFTIDDRTRWR